MKVKIDGYSDYFGPYQLAEKLCFWVKDEVDEYGIPRKPDWVHDFGEWLAHGSVEPEPEVGEVRDFLSGKDRKITWLYKFLLWIEKVKPERKVEVRIDRYDTWSMDYTLGLIALPMLKQLKEEKHGAPFVDLEDRPAHLIPDVEPNRLNGDTDEFHFQAWDWVMDEMIFAFETKSGDNQDWEDQFRSGEIHFQTKKLDNGMSELVKGPNDTSETDWEGMRSYGERIQNGFRLFGKYYQSLWD